MIKNLILDVEATTRNKGNPFNSLNKLVLVGLYYNNVIETFVIEHNQCLEPYNKKLARIQELINQAETIVGFNLKFDLHWLRRYGIIIPDVKVWDVQIAHFIEKDQQHDYPSLNDVCDFYYLDPKLDIIKTEYWDKGVESTDIPIDIFTEYLVQDLKCTADCQEKQLETIKPSKQKLIQLQGLDLLVLEEMEFNGILYDKDESLREGERIDREVEAIEARLNNIVSNSGFINWGSGDHKSVVLYGGVIEEEVFTPYIKKDGTKSTTRRNKTIVRHTFPRLIEPLRKSKLKKTGYYATDEGTFKKLKPKGKAKEIINLLLERSGKQKENGTYFKGIPKLIEECNWENYIHGTLNQCVAITGRLSSNNPNLQNNPESINKLFRSRYAN